MKSGNSSVRFHSLFSQTAFYFNNSTVKLVLYCRFFLRTIFKSFIFFYFILIRQMNKLLWSIREIKTRKVSFIFSFSCYACMQMQHFIFSSIPLQVTYPEGQGGTLPTIQMPISPMYLKHYLLNVIKSSLMFSMAYL